MKGIEQSILTHFEKNGFDKKDKTLSDVIEFVKENYFIIDSERDIIKKRKGTIPINNIKTYLYVLINKKEIVYVGISDNISYRVGQHHYDKIFDSVYYKEIDESNKYLVEFSFIAKFKPKYNNEIKMKYKLIDFINESIY